MGDYTKPGRIGVQPGPVTGGDVPAPMKPGIPGRKTPPITGPGGGGGSMDPAPVPPVGGVPPLPTPGLPGWGPSTPPPGLTPIDPDPVPRQTPMPRIGLGELGSGNIPGFTPPVDNVGPKSFQGGGMTSMTNQNRANTTPRIPPMQGGTNEWYGRNAPQGQPNASFTPPPSAGLSGTAKFQMQKRKKLFPEP